MTLADLPIEGFDPAGAPLGRIGHRRLRQQLGPIFTEIHRQGGAIEVVKDGRPEAVIVDYDVFARLTHAAHDVASLRESIPLLVAAVAAGVTVPSDTLERLGLPPAPDEDALKRFRSRYPVRITHDEDGRPLPAAAPTASGGYQEADEDELVLTDDDE